MYVNSVGQDRTFTPHMTVHLVISLPKYRIYTVYKWLWLPIRDAAAGFKQSGCVLSVSLEAGLFLPLCLPR
jgi:hypothetical protein